MNYGISRKSKLMVTLMRKDIKNEKENLKEARKMLDELMYELRSELNG